MSQAQSEQKRVGQMYRETLVDSIKDGVENNDNVFLLSYSHLSSGQLSDFRKSLINAGADMRVFKNRIAAIALKDIKQEELAEKIDGQTAFVWSKSDSVEISKILVKFAKDCETFNVKGGLLDGKALEEADIKRLSDLPSREVLLAQLLGTIQAPLTRLMGAMNAKSRELLSILKQYGEQKGGS